MENKKRYDIIAFVLALVPFVIFLISGYIAGAIGSWDGIGFYLYLGIPIAIISLISSVIYTIVVGRNQETRKSNFWKVALAILCLEFFIPIILLILDSTIGI